MSNKTSVPEKTVYMYICKFSVKTLQSCCIVMLLHACVSFLSLFGGYMWTKYQTVNFSCFQFSPLLALKVFVDFAPPQSHIISVRKCVFTREGGSEWRCWCIEQSCLSLLKAFVSWGSLFITKPLVGRDIKTGCDPGVSPLTSVNPRGQIFSNCAITISWPQGL